MNMEECVKRTFAVFACIVSVPSARGLLPWFIFGALLLLLLGALRYG